MSPTVTTAFDDARARGIAWLTAWDSQGAHRTATSGDEAGGLWLAREAAGLAGIGIQDTTVNLRNKVARGRFSAMFLVQCLSAMGARTLRIEENQDAQYRDEIATAASGSDDRAIMHLTEQREAGAVSEYVAEELAEEVFRAMMAARPRSPSLPKSELEEDARRTCEGA